MIPYGKKKRTYKLHPHNQCTVCAENKVNKKTARRKAKQQIREETNTKLKNERYAITKQQTGYITLLVIPRQISIDHKTN
jgi:hypothetical protein